MEVKDSRDWSGNSGGNQHAPGAVQQEHGSGTWQDEAIVTDAALTVQRAFRRNKELRAMRTNLVHAMVFGGASLLRWRGSSVGNVSCRRREQTRVRGGKLWPKDKEFRHVLKSSILEGYEDLYIHYAAIEEQISLISQFINLSAPGSPAEQESASEPFLDPVYNGAVQDTVRNFWIELDRVDQKFEAAVDEVVSILQLLKAEAVPRRIVSSLPDGISTGPKALDTVQHMQNGLHFGLKAALKDLYKKMFILMQIASLDYVGFRKLQIRYEEMLGLTDCQRAEVPTRADIRSRPFFLQMSHMASETTRTFFQAMDDVEAMYANLFTDQDIKVARSYLRSFRMTPPTIKQAVMLGIQGGMSLILLVWAGWLLMMDPDDDLECPFCTRYLVATIPVFRILLVPIIGIWTWAVGVKVWEKHNVNYSFILQMDTLNNMGAIHYFSIALQLVLLMLVCFVVYVSSIRTGWYPHMPHIEPTIWPIVTLMIFFVYSVWPTGHSKNLSNYFLAGLSKTVVRPFGSKPVGFAENFIADILTSMVIVLRDITTVVSFYFCGGATGLPEKEEPMWLRKIQGPLITALPYFWRFMQCIRRAYDAKGSQASIPHMINAGKYVLSLTSITMAVLGCEHGCKHFYTDKEHWTIGRITWFSALVLGTIYSYVWDIFMDWSLFTVDKDGKRWLFGLLPALRLREKRSYKATWFYYWAAVTNLGGRLMWALSINPYSNGTMAVHGSVLASPQAFTTLVAVVELLRRGQWFLLRIENEYMTNASHYRSISSVPVMITFAELRLGKKHLMTGDEEQRHITSKQIILIALCVAMAVAAVTIVWMQTVADTV